MKKRKINLFRIFMTIFIIYSVVVLINLQFKIEESKKQNRALEQKIEQVNKENERLKTILESANSLEYLEKAAREQLGMVKPGERVYINQSAGEGNAAVEGSSKDGDKQ